MLSACFLSEVIIVLIPIIQNLTKMKRNLINYLSLGILIALVFTGMNSSSQNIISCYPATSNYWTGSTTATAKTETELIYALAGGSRGWMKFDISAIPDNAIITSVQLNYYIMGTFEPYYRFTKLASDPVTTAAANLFALIGQASSSTSPNTYFDYTSFQQSGQVSCALNSFAISNLQTSLVQNWFAVGLIEYEQSTYYLQVAGWATAGRPYISVTYTAAAQNDIGIQSINSPATQIVPGNFPVRILLKNYGSNMINSALINWSLNGIAMPQINFNDTISPGISRLVVLSPSYNFPAGTHVLSATVSMPNNVQDPNPTNNTKVQTIYSITPPVTFDIDTAAACPGSTVVIPVKTWNFKHVTSLSLRALYNGTSLQYTGYQSVHPGLSNFSITSVPGTNASISLNANSSTSMNIPADDTLISLIFTYLGGNGNLSWDTATNACIVHDTLNSAVPLNLYNGQVYSIGPIIYTQPPAILNVTSGLNASIYVGAYAYTTLTYQWQASTSGGSVWTNLMNSNNFSGVTTSTLSLIGIQSNFQGVKFRCVINSICPSIISNITTLQIATLPVYCVLDSISSCSLGNLDIPVRLHSFGSVTSFSLKLLYNSSNLTYLNWSGLNANLPSPNSFSVVHSGDTLKFTWSSTSLNGFDTGTLVHLHFSVNGPGCAVVLNWLNNNTIHSVFYGSNGQALTSYFYNGWVCVNHAPVAAGQISGPISVCPGQTNVSFTVPAVTYANSYLWTLPAGTSFASGGNTNTIIVNFGNSFSGGNLQVKGSNSCGYGQASVLPISICSPQPDTIQCILPEVTVCHGLIHYPVILNNASGLASISLGVIFNTNKLSYQGYSNPFPGLASGFLGVNASSYNIQIGWFSVTPVNMDQDTLLCIDFIADTGWSALYFNLQTAGACYLTDYNSNQLAALYTNGFIYAGGCTQVNGTITYDNNLPSPISNTVVNLSSVYSAVSGNSGNFSFAGVQNGLYQLGATITKAAGGINATDALKVLNHFVNTAPLTGMKLLAADVDGTGFINSSDGLMIVKRFVGLINTFPVGNWLVSQQQVNATGSATITANLKALCYGDLDGSFVPAIKESPAVELKSNGQFIKHDRNSFSLPLIFSQPATVGAVSLILMLDEGFVLTSVDCPFLGNLVFNQTGNEIRIAWYSLNAMNSVQGEKMMTLNFKYTGSEELSSISEFKLSVIGESNVANPHSEMIENFSLEYPSQFSTSAADITVSPNPAVNNCRITFEVPANSEYSLSLYNSQGQEIISFTYPGPAESIQSKVLNLSGLEAGLYMAVIESRNGLQKIKILKE